MSNKKIFYIRNIINQKRNPVISFILGFFTFGAVVGGLIAANIITFSKASPVSTPVKILAAKPLTLATYIIKVTQSSPSVKTSPNIILNYSDNEKTIEVPKGSVIVVRCLGDSRALVSSATILEPPSGRINLPNNDCAMFDSISQGTAIIKMVSTPPPGKTVLIGKAIISPNSGEGLSVQYTQTENGATFHPFLPLRHFIDNNTIITDKDGKQISLDKIVIGDDLLVYYQGGAGVMAVRGQKGGIMIKISTIQDLTR